MTVKEIFELRKQSRIEEAYDAIRPMYAAHKGKYTSLCMFWTAADIFKLRLDQGRVEEAAKILEALKRVLPYIKDKDLRPENNDVPALGIDNKTRPASETAAGFITSASRRLSQAQKKQEKKQPAANTTEHKSESIASSIPSSKEDIGHNREICVPKEEEHKPVANTEFSNSPILDKKPDSVKLSNLCPKDEISIPKEKPDEDDPEEKNNVRPSHPSSNSDDDLSGHLAVSLDEGIIRPIEGINAPQRVVLACLTAHPGYSVPQISDSTGIPAKSIERHISALIERGLIEHRGSKNTGGYYVM